MKTRLILPVLVGTSLLVLTAPVIRADNGNPGPNKHSLESNEEFEGKFRLLPTTNAPADAKGHAEIQSNNEGGSQTGTIKVETHGLADGDYTVSIVKGSDGSSVEVGQITVGSGGNTNSQAEDQNNEDGGNELTLPPDVDPLDIVQVVVSDSSGTAMLVGDLSDSSGGSKSNFNAKVPLTPGDAAPDASGFAQLHSRVRKGKARNQFLMIAKNVPASSVFTVEVDGTAVGTAKSNKKGKVMVKRLPASVSSVSTVRLVDASDGEVVRADF